MPRVDPLALPLTLSRAEAASFAAEPSWPSDRVASRSALLRDPDGQRISIAELSRRIPQLHTTTIREVINGWCRPTLKTGLLISRALSISPWRFLAYSEHMRSLRGSPSRRPVRLRHPNRQNRTESYDVWQRNLAALEKL